MAIFDQCLKSALKLRGMTQKSLGSAVGKTHIYVNQLCSGAKLPSMGLFFDLCAALSLSPAEFFALSQPNPALSLSDAEAALVLHFRRLSDGERKVASDMIAALASRRRPRALPAKPRATAARYTTHRSVSGYAAAGLPLFDPAADAEIEVPAKYHDGDRYTLCIARGDSMQPDIMNGDVVVVERGTQAESGMTALVHIESPTSADGEYTIKRFYRFGDHAELRSVNPAHRTLLYPMRQILTAERVVHIIHKSK